MKRDQGTATQNPGEASTIRMYGVRLLGIRDIVGNAPCRRACPVYTDAGLYASLVGKGQFSEAFAVAKRPNPLVQTCARICGHPCESQCRLGRVDSPVSIRALKRFLADFACKTGNLAALAKAPKRHSTRVAIVGSGPAGLSAAYGLAQSGHHVTVFEALPLPGGMLRYGIPEYRLPKARLDQELQSIWDAGVELKTGCKLGDDFSLEDLMVDDYQAVFLAIGAQKGLTMGIEGETHPGVVSAVDFLRDVARGQGLQASQKVLVVGGGFTAIDASRTARRLGATQVRVLYRRSRDQMPADQEEVKQAEEEGVQFEFLATPQRVLVDDSGTLSLQLTRTQLVRSGEQSRPAPIPVPGSEFSLQADLIIVATGQRPDLDFLDGGRGEVAERCEESLYQVAQGLSAVSTHRAEFESKVGASLMNDLQMMTSYDGPISVRTSLARQIRVTQAGTIAVDGDTLATGAPRVFAGGDAAFGPRLVINAIADGARAAAAIDRMLLGRSADRISATRVTYLATPIAASGEARARRQAVPTRSVDKRSEHQEVELGYDEKLAKLEGKRCLQCFANTIFDASKCILCGGCVDVCPQGCLKLVSLRQTYGGDENTARFLDSLHTPPVESRGATSGDIKGRVAIIKDEERCNRCGLCVRRCPTGAISLVSVERKEESKIAV